MYVSGITIPQLDSCTLRDYSERNIGQLAGNAFNKAALFVCLSVVFSLLGTESDNKGVDSSDSPDSPHSNSD